MFTSEVRGSVHLNTNPQKQTSILSIGDPAAWAYLFYTSQAWSNHIIQALHHPKTRRLSFSDETVIDREFPVR